ncbi:MAG: hypothetical protein ABJM29_00330 [Rhizobiaceae bacterium]
MSKSIVAAIAITAGVLIAPMNAQAAGPIGNQQALTETSQVQQIKQSHRHKKRIFRKKHRRGHRHVGGHFFFGHDYHDRPYYRSCRYLKRKAYRTGSRHWWRKYRRCMDRNYY